MRPPTTDLTALGDAILGLASLEPPLAYVPAPVPSSATTCTEDALAAYFAAQPDAYVRELDGFLALNVPNTDARCFLFVVCYNELANLPRMVELYAAQHDERALQVTFLVNYTLREDVHKTTADETTFRQSTSLLLRLKQQHDFIHVVAKRFSSHTGGLARARKYAMDYSLRACGASRDPDAGVLVSNEGDTLDLSAGYVRSYLGSVGTGSECFVQGRVAYPAEIRAAPLLALYCDVRERVHIGQGLHDRRYPGYEGIMPIGRNYGVHPKVACLAGGIDPVALRSAEDDLTFGFDIYHELGNGTKHYAEDIVLTTHPRREILIVRGLLSSRHEDAKSMYENFHGESAIYDIAWEEYMNAVDDIGAFADTVARRCLVVNQFYQWVFRTVMKNYFWLDRDSRAVFDDNRGHHIGYWEREARLWEIYQRKLVSLTPAHRQRFLTLVVEESLAWFNDLVSGLARFSTASIELDSRLLGTSR